MTTDVVFPDAEYLHRAFHGQVAASPMSVAGAASRMIPIYHQRRSALRQLQEPDRMSCQELRQVFGDFTAAEISLSALVAIVDRAIATAMQGRNHVAGVWHTETVGFVISRMADLWLNYLDSQSHEDAFRIARMSDAYNCLITELAGGRRLPPDV